MNIYPTAVVSPKAELAENVEVGPYAIIEDNVKVGRGTKILANAYLTGWTEIGEDCEIHMGAVIGHLPQDITFDKSKVSHVKIGDRNIFREYTTVHRSKFEGKSTIIGNDNYFMGFSHVAHDCIIGNNIVICNGALVAGHVEIEDRAFISGNTTIHQFIKIGKIAMMGGLSATSKDVPPYMTMRGYSTVATVNVLGLERAGLSKEAISLIKQAFRILYKSGYSVPHAVKELEKLGDSPEVCHLIDFIKNSKNGICGFRRLDLK